MLLCDIRFIQWNVNGLNSVPVKCSHRRSRFRTLSGSVVVPLFVCCVVFNQYSKTPLSPPPSRSRASSESAPDEEMSRHDDGSSLGAPSPLVQGPLSSDDSDVEGAEEPAPYPSSSSHPRPLAVRPLTSDLSAGSGSGVTHIQQFVVFFNHGL